SNGLQIDRRSLTLLAALEVEADLLAFVQIADTRALDRRDMHEHVLRAVLRLNEPVPLGGIEPFDCTDRHSVPPERKCRRAKGHSGPISDRMGQGPARKHGNKADPKWIDHLYMALPRRDYNRSASGGRSDGASDPA